MTRLEALTALAEKVERGEDDVYDLMIPVFGENAFHIRWFFQALSGGVKALGSAQALHEAVLPGWAFEIGCNPFMDAAIPAFRAMVGWLDGEGRGDSTTPARAWLLAILRALIAQEQAQ